MKTILADNNLTLCLDGRIDTNNASALEADIFAAVNANTGADISIDAKKLEYISSAGLRVLMKLRKQAKKTLPLINVSSEVYEIFEVTGFTEMFDVQKRLRELSVEGCQVVGKGATATVYRLNPETVVKVFRPNVSLEVIKQENERARRVFLNGIPSAIAFDIVKVGDSYGSVYELLNAEDFISVLRRDKDHLDEYITRFAKAMKEMHKVEVDQSSFPSTKMATLAQFPRFVEAGVLTETELEQFEKLYASIPERSTFIHGDCHPGNVMLQDGEFVFIDTMTCGYGHPVFDLSSMCFVYHIGPKPTGTETSPLIEGFKVEERKRIWDVYICA